MNKNRRILTKIVNIICMSLVLALICGCGSNDEVAGNGYSIYFFADDGNSIVPEEIYTDISMDETEALAAFMLEKMSGSADTASLKPVLGEDTGYQGFIYSDGQITVDFSADFDRMPPYKAALIRAAITRTLTQIADVNTVSCTVEGNPMTYSSGAVIGPMSAGSFIENAGAQINPNESTKLTLYFASEDGKHLIKTVRNVTYSSNISLDKLVIEQLIEGPGKNEKGGQTINTDTNIISVTTQDGICYVNLDNKFLSGTGNADATVAIYSVVNSLSELGTVNKVQFSVDGDSDIMFMETISLKEQFSQNLDLIE